MGKGSDIDLKNTLIPQSVVQANNLENIRLKASVISNLK